MLKKIPDDMLKDMFKSISKSASKNIEWLTYLFKNHLVQSYKSAQSKFVNDAKTNIKVRTSNLFKDKKFVNKLIITLLIIGVSSAGAIGYSIWARNVAQKAQKDKILTKTLKDADVLSNTGKKESAEQAYDEAIKMVDDPSKKINLILQKAMLYSNDSKYDEALAIAKEAESVTLDANAASYIGSLYERKGDKQKAIEYYQKTISLIDKTISGSDEYIKDYQRKIDWLKAVDG